MQFTYYNIIHLRYNQSNLIKFAALDFSVHGFPPRDQQSFASQILIWSRPAFNNPEVKTKEQLLSVHITM